jgi:hypothetical protein
LKRYIGRAYSSFLYVHSKIDGRILFVRFPASAADAKSATTQETNRGFIVEVVKSSEGSRFVGLEVALDVTHIWGRKKRDTNFQELKLVYWIEDCNMAESPEESSSWMR